MESERLYILQNITKDMLIKEPFPHYIIEKPLEDAVYSELLRKFPVNGFSGKYENRGQNQRKNFRGYDVLRDKKHCPQIWKDFVKTHSTDRIYADMAELFDIEDKTPRLRMRYDPEEADVEIECQISINTPVKEKSSVKLAHVDEQDKICCALYYFPRPDDCYGGDLEVYRKSKKVGAPEVEFVDNYVKNMESLQLQNVVKYKPNTLFLFLNTRDAIHAVSPREVCGINRQFVNIVARKTTSLPDERIINRTTA